MDYPQSGGKGQDLSICYSHSPQPARLGQDTSLHGVQTKDTLGTFATTTGVLQNRFRYYKVDLATTESILVLHKRFWYYRFDFGTTESILVLQNLSLIHI